MKKENHFYFSSKRLHECWSEFDNFKNFGMSVVPISFNRPQPPFPIVGPPTYPTSYPPYLLPTLLPIYHTFYVPYLLPTLLPTYTPTYLPYFLPTLPPTHPTSYLSYLLPTLPPTYPESKITENSEHLQI